MAKIENTKKQIEALKKVMSALDDIRQINSIIEKAGTISITRTDPDKKTYTVSLLGKYENQTIKMLAKQKKVLIKTINKTVKSNHIVLNDSEKALINDTPRIETEAESNIVHLADEQSSPTIATSDENMEPEEKVSDEETNTLSI